MAVPPLAGGCGVERTLQIESNPPGALVHLNGEEVGRTPMRKAFVWYGTYDVQLRKDGDLPAMGDGAASQGPEIVDGDRGILCGLPR